MMIRVGISFGAICLFQHVVCLCEDVFVSIFVHGEIYEVFDFCGGRSIVIFICRVCEGCIFLAENEFQCNWSHRSMVIYGKWHHSISLGC